MSSISSSPQEEVGQSHLSRGAIPLATTVANQYGTAEDAALAHDVAMLRNIGPTGVLRPLHKEWLRSAVVRQFYWCCFRQTEA
jgi:hypothetical protein